MNPKPEDWIDVRDRIPTEEENRPDQDGEERLYLVRDLWGDLDLANFENGKWYGMKYDWRDATWFVVAWMCIPDEPQWLVELREERRKKFK